MLFDLSEMCEANRVIMSRMVMFLLVTFSELPFNWMIGTYQIQLQSHSLPGLSPFVIHLHRSVGS